MDLHKKGDPCKKLQTSVSVRWQWGHECSYGWGRDEGPSIHKELSRGIKVFDGGSMGLKGGMAVVEVVVKWNDGGIGEEVVVKGDRRLPCTFLRFRLWLQGDGRSLDIGQVLTALVLYLGLAQVVHSSYFLSYRERGDSIAIIKRRRQDLHHDCVRDPATASGRGWLNVDLESSTERESISDLRISLSQQPPATTHTELTARVNKLLKMRHAIDSLLSKTINELTNQSFDAETFCPRERNKELELRTQQRNNFEEEFFKDMFLTKEELAYHK
nr:hypothetical protein [Tanacetum cinerariifolium]